ncbi:Hpt domain-containing protein [Methylobacillus arboreus]|uniref:hybrid sensor histidine kinase/response regulator n=1 Tax=Methylobacillus arboreus TaxID=755170 RepID=UPI001E44BBAF|nr:Hpt domain-containing protein [Methylobacillus arboreus]MCB5190007.1 Hpt domain-containing protein [Methylobacillus arboreus]
MEDFDIGPLSWVKGEIDQALDQVLAQLTALATNPQDFSPLRFAKTHLYQVNGAFDMVGLEGCKRYCSEIETVVAKLDKAELALENEVVDTLRYAILHLQQYLQELMNGEPDQPLRLSLQLQRLAALHGEALEDSELFFPDTSQRLPKHIPTENLDPQALLAAFKEQRAQFQKFLLGWLKGELQALQEMATALERVQLVVPQAAPKTLWWVATAFIDTLAEDTHASDAGVKRLCRRLDQELRAVSEGINRPASILLRDLLYFIATSGLNTERIKAVRELFELNGLIPGGTTEVLGTEEQQYVKQCQVALEALKSIWDRANEGGAVLEEFMARFGGILNTYPALSSEPVKNLFGGVHDAVLALQAGNAANQENILIEVASALTLLSDALQQYGQQDAQAQLELERQQARLQALLGGQTPALAPATALQQAAQHALTRETGAALQEVEQLLDAYFRQPGELAPLSQAVAPLRQVSAALDMLEMPEVKTLTHAAEDVLAGLQQGRIASSQEVFEALADSLSLVGLYVQQYPHAASGAFALEDTLARLQDAQNVVRTESDAGQVTADIAQPLAPALPDDELLDVYLTEAEEVLASVAQHLQALRINATNHEALAEVRRGFHTLKGSGRTVGLADLGEVAAIVEALLNVLIDRKLTPGPAVIAFVEDSSAAFAGWVAALREKASAGVPVSIWQERAIGLQAGLSGLAPDAQPEEVVIGGTRKVSRTLFEVFLQEAGQHLEQLQDWLQLVLHRSEPILIPDADSRRAAHTLASNAGSTGFNALSDLARALEYWLDAHQGNWTEQTVTLLQNTVNALEKMLAKARERKQPRAATALLRALKKAAEDAAIPVIDAVTGSNVVPLAPRLAKTEDVMASLLEAEAEVSGLIDKPLAEEAETSIDSTHEPLPPVVKTVAETSLQQPVDQELFALFVEEANDLMPVIGSELRAWHARPKDAEHPDMLQRALHTLKGSARMAAQGRLGDAVHGMEDLVMRALKHAPQAEDFAEMFAGLDHIGSLLEEALGGQTALVVGRQLSVQGPGRERRVQHLRLRAETLDRLINEAGEVSIARSRLEREMQEFKQSSQDLTESVQRLRNYLRELEIEAESQLQSRMTLLQESNETFDPLEFDRFTRLQELTRMMAESVNDVSTIQQGLLRNLDETEAALQQQSRMNRDLQYGLMSVRRVPFSLIAERLHRIVRQTARELDKQVELTLDGVDTEIDRSVLDRMGAAIEHILRNAVAHGIETPEERRSHGKSAHGSITLRIRQENDEIMLTVSDDGAGVNLAQVRERALAQHLLQPDQEVSSQALLALIFEPGFTTARTLSQISGRGVGLDAVRSDITALGGRIDVSSSQGTGAIFSIFLPVTLSVSQAVLVRYSERKFALPAVMVEQVVKLKPDALTAAYADGKLSWASHDYPLYFLGRLCGDAQAAAESQRYTPVMLLRSGQYRIALHVDDILGSQEVVMKQIGPQLARVPGMIGATVLGDGGIVLIINPLQLANREALSAGSVNIAVTADASVAATKPLALLVDDSLTMRKVLGRFLEREGYDVVTAKDGMEAIQAMQQALPAVILTDIEMPRMDGFELARNVRDDERTRDIPLIIVSSRTAEKHQALATSLGVNAFFGKPVQEDELAAKLRQLLA